MAKEELQQMTVWTKIETAQQRRTTGLEDESCKCRNTVQDLSLIHISEPTRPY